MNILTLGISHRTAPIALLERVIPVGEAAAKILVDASTAPHVRAAVLLATCNRVELYAEVERFHGGTCALAELLAQYSGTSPAALIPHLYVHYDEAAVSHLFTVACGLDSMVVGETQILGQVKAALGQAQDAETISPALNSVFQQALRVGKRAQRETDIGRTGRSVVSAALDHARKLGGTLHGAQVLLVGAGSMAALAGTALHHEYGANIVVANRTTTRGDRLATSLGGRSVPLAELGTELASADLVLSCTGAVGAVVTTEAVRQALAQRPDRPLLVVDLALPHDVEVGVGELGQVRLIDLATIGAASDTLEGSRDVTAVRAIIAEEVDRFATTSTRAAAVTPTVVALRTRASEVVEAELHRLERYLPDLDDAERAEVAKTVRRVVDKLLHTPTIRVKELAEQTVETSYDEALRQLFALDLATVDQVVRPPEAGA